MEGGVCWGCNWDRMLALRKAPVSYCGTGPLAGRDSGGVEIGESGYGEGGVVDGVASFEGAHDEAEALDFDVSK